MKYMEILYECNIYIQGNIRKEVKKEIKERNGI